MPVILGGDSSGGGLAIRFAGGPFGYMADGFLLIAPFLKYDAPTTRRNSGGWAYPATRRIIGLAMLNMLGITALNHLPVIAFAMPQSVLDGPYGDSVTSLYSYRLNTAYAPRMDYQSDLRAITRPLLVLAGAADEAFYGERYQEVIAAETDKGQYHLLPSAGHIDILNDARIVPLIEAWLEDCCQP